MKTLFLITLCLLAMFHLASAQQKLRDVLLRADDIGMNHSVNMALEDVCKTGVKFSASVMFACPWYQEAVAILKKYPAIAVGIHLTLTSEWRYYRWGPVVGKTGAPSLVDSLGYFYENEEQFLKSGYTLQDVEKELTAQLDRAIASGLTITYMDPHMGVALLTPELRTLTEKLAKKYNLGISTLGNDTYYQEAYKDMWAIPVETKKQAFLKHLTDGLMHGRPNLVVLHIARNTPEMAVLEMPDFLISQHGVPMAAQHRQAELDMLLSTDFRNLIDKKFNLITYRDLIKQGGAKKKQHD